MLLLGDPRLYQKSEAIDNHELAQIKGWVSDLDNVMKEIRAKFNFGRGIAAPQLGIMKRLIYIQVREPMIIINPEIVYKSDELFEIWDDCMCFPQLFVKVLRHKTIKIKYLDQKWDWHEETLENDMAELFQHEYDHLEGVLCTMRAINL